MKEMARHFSKTYYLVTLSPILPLLLLLLLLIFLIFPSISSTISVLFAGPIVILYIYKGVSLKKVEGAIQRLQLQRGLPGIAGWVADKKAVITIENKDYALYRPPSTLLSQIKEGTTVKLKVGLFNSVVLLEWNKT